MLHRYLALLPVLAALPLATIPATGDDLYTTQVQPLLVEKCAACHGALRQEAGLRLDHGGLLRAGGESGPIIDTASPDSSELLARVTTDDLSLRMPPEGEGAALTEQQVQSLRTWIADGARSPADETVPVGPDQHWAFQPLVRPLLPSPKGFDASNPIDAFVLAKLGEQGLHPMPIADKRTRQRRATLDLIGLPPSEAEQTLFLTDDSATSWPELVDDLLERPSYGQRWARHWMDVWRYSDWDGYKEELRSSQRHIWHWREWIIDALNTDKGYDQMIVEMLAGDELEPTNDEVLRATGFLARNYHKSNRDIWLDATVEHTAKAFLGLTLNCARCHDHKYDPLAQRDYYAFRAIFEPHQVRTERLPGQADLLKAGLPRAYDAKPDEPTYLYLGGNEKHPDKEHPIVASVPALFDIPFEVEPIELPGQAVFPALRPHQEAEDLAAAEQKTLAARQALLSSASAENDMQYRIASQALLVAEVELAALRTRWAADKARYADTPVPQSEWEPLRAAALAAEYRERVERAKLAVLEKQSQLEQAVDKPDARKTLNGELEKARQAAAAAEQELTNVLASLSGEAKSSATASEQAANAPEFHYTSVGQAYPKHSTGRRLALARWITHRDHPLTARVAVNYVWMHHFGQPLVANVFDFGLRSPEPVHRPLLDWLAVELIEHDWSLKHLHRLIVNSQTYQMSSASHDAPAIWQSNLRIDPDNLLFWRANVRRLEAEVIRDSMLHVAGNLDMSPGGPDIDFALGETNYRRSLYFRHAYEKQMQMLVLFDAAAPTECYRRSPSIIPQQALALANSPLSFDQSRQLAAHLWQRSAENSSEQSRTELEKTFIDLAFLRILSRPCTAEEQDICGQFLVEQEQLLADKTGLKPMAGKSQARTAPSVNAAQRARENLVHALMNHNDFVTVR